MIKNLLHSLSVPSQISALAVSLCVAFLGLSSVSSIAHAEDHEKSHEATQIKEKLLLDTDITNKWYKVPTRNIVTLETHYGDVVIALNPALAPHHVKRFRKLIKTDFYQQEYFYRVIDGFVAQGGSNENHEPSPETSNLQAEFIAPLSASAVVIEENDMFAPATGFLNGFPVGMDKARNEMWALHCPGTVAFARNSEKDTASTEFYIVIGQAPRHLDRNMSVIGRVLDGMDVLQQLPRGPIENSGVIEVPSDKSQIKNSALGNKDTSGKQYYIQLPSHPEYQKRMKTGQTLDNSFFHDKVYSPRPIDVCYYQTKTSSTPWN
ncbi:peptidylprolyl isomerase [Alteromonas stellipolaris]|uniref:peptidylprolyl isomerase n=1 Tax=Alteromonas stellipolaris TaxID=233316 RepID=UPI0027344603|nr:peptidylprolyl isomerase [Alteromonas stellipolaris]MDP2537142.1 peptidylprolyl isomerase [Alteromonas stellipolaris]